MYEEGNRKISFNWGSLIVKLIILAIIIFLICFVVTRLIRDNNSSNNNLAIDNTDYITNITAMKDAAFEYFTSSKLPQSVGGTEKLTLSQMLNQKLLIDFTDDGDICDINSSYVQTTKTADGNYALKVSLDCGDKSDFIVTTIENCNNNTCNNINEDDKTNTDIVIDNTPLEENNSTNADNQTNSNSNSSNTTSGITNSSNSSTSSSSKVTTTVKTTVKVKVSCSSINCCYNCNTNNDDDKKPTEDTIRYYKFVKWSDWQNGYSDDPNDENKKITTTTYEYCKYSKKTYYSMCVITDFTPNNTTFKHELQLTDIVDSEVKEGSVQLSGSSYFASGLTDYQKFIDNKGKLTVTSNNKTATINISDPQVLQSSSLRNDNFTFSVSDLYKANGIYKTALTINYKNHNYVTPYYVDSVDTNVYFIPLKFTVSFAYKDDCVRDTEENQELYNGYGMSDPQTETVWMHRTPTYKWSTETSLDGYEYTGIYEDRKVS